MSKTQFPASWFNPTPSISPGAPGNPTFDITQASDCSQVTDNQFTCFAWYYSDCRKELDQNTLIVLAICGKFVVVSIGFLIHFYIRYRNALKRKGFQGSRVDKLRAVDRTNLTLELDKYRTAVMHDDLIIGHTAYLEKQREEYEDYAEEMERKGKSKGKGKGKAFGKFGFNRSEAGSQDFDEYPEYASEYNPDYGRPGSYPEYPLGVDEFGADILHELKKNFLKKIFGYEARCEFWVKIGLRFWILVGYVDFLA